METRLIRRGTIVLLCLCCVQFVFWSGQYLYWPWWSDHDVFSTVARSWDAGYLPYRDQLCNNFPGTIYQFWLVGKLFGWGNTGAYNAFDQLLFLLLVATLLSWSYRRFASLLPGAIATASLCSYYFNQDFSMVAQRDWHAALWCAMAIMVLNSGPTRLSMALGALCYAFGLVIRPQVVSWAPALVLALDEQVRRPCEPLARTAPRAIAGASLTAMFLVLFFMPILGNGVGG